MTSKEIVLNEIKKLEHNLKIYEKENMTTQIEYAKTNIIVNNLILKDLEDYEELKKIMGTPIQNIMKRLKKLEKQNIIITLIIEKSVNINAVKATKNYMEYNDFVAWICPHLTKEEYIKIKEYIGNNK